MIYGREKMAVTVLIKRKVAPGNESLLEELFREMRGAALSQKGYIGGDINPGGCNRRDSYHQ